MMRLSPSATSKYTSSSQKIRVMSEAWVNTSIFCPNCGKTLVKFENNQPVADFQCNSCPEQYELKSKSGSLAQKIVDGAFSTMIERLNSDESPNFFFLTYDKNSLQVQNFLTIPKYFFTTDIIERRNPLAATARRAGWVGCNILMTGIPEYGKIFYIHNGIPMQREEVLAKWERTNFVRETKVEARGWLFDISLCIEKLGKQEFTLEEMYRFENHLQGKHPDNNNIRPKIRQQLQILRDRNLLEFVGNGKYRRKQVILPPNH